MKKRQTTVKFMSIIFSVFFISCAFDLAHIKYEPAILTECSENCPTFAIKEEVPLSNMPCGYKRKLKENSEWKMVGSIEEGKVYKPLNHCFTVECSNVFEAYIVLDGDQINGFYLPVEDGYVALKPPVDIVKK